MILQAEGIILAVEPTKMADGKIIYKNFVQMKDDKVNEIYSVNDFSSVAGVAQNLSFAVYKSFSTKAWKVSLKATEDV